MSRELFPVIQFADGLFDDYPSNETGTEEGGGPRFPRARERALRRALHDRCIVFGEPPGRPSQFNFSYLRRLIQPHWEGNTEGLEDLDAWENSSLGLPFGTTVVQQGRPVIEALQPAFVSNRRLYAIDPYLVPFKTIGKKKKKKTVLDNQSNFDRLVRLCRSFNSLQGITRLGCKPDDVAEARLRCGLIASYLRSKNLKGKLESISLFLYPFGIHVHDRFLGFANSPENSDSWHALALGYGVASLSDHKSNQVCLARITSRHFNHVWERTQRQCDWAILMEKEAQDLGSHWRRIDETPAGDSVVRILHRSSRKDGRKLKCSDS